MMRPMHTCTRNYISHWDLFIVQFVSFLLQNEKVVKCVRDMIYLYQWCISNCTVGQKNILETEA